MDNAIVVQVTGSILGVLFLVNIYLWVRLNAINKKYSILMKDSEDKTLQDMFIQRVEQMNAALVEVEQIKKSQQLIREQLRGCVQKTALVRFNAYGDLAGDLSYAVAVLDENNDGVVLSCLTSRQDVRCYARDVENGQHTTKYPFTGEEQEAVDLAKNKFAANDK